MSTTLVGIGLVSSISDFLIIPQNTYIGFHHAGWNVLTDKYSFAKVPGKFKPDNILYWHDKQADSSLKVSKRSFQVLETKGAASDHLPVLATLEFGGSSGDASVTGTNDVTGNGYKNNDGVKEGDDEAPERDDSAVPDENPADADAGNYHHRGIPHTLARRPSGGRRAHTI